MERRGGSSAISFTTRSYRFNGILIRQREDAFELMLVAMLEAERSCGQSEGASESPAEMR